MSAPSEAPRVRVVVVAGPGPARESGTTLKVQTVPGCAENKKVFVACGASPLARTLHPLAQVLEHALT